MKWQDVGDWLKSKGGTLLGLAGAVATGNVPAGIAAVASLVTEATGESTPALALAKLQGDPAMVLKLEELIKANEQSIREHQREMLRMQIEADSKEHDTQQTTIREGDKAGDEYVRHTRPMMARQSWYATAGYVIVFEGARALGYAQSGASWDLAAVLMAPAAAYLGFRSLDKFTSSRAVVTK